MGVYKKNNRWYLDYYLPSGERKREVVSINGVSPDRITRQDAIKALDMRRGEIAGGKFNIADTVKPVIFDKLAGTFLEDYSKINKLSWKRDRTSCRALIEYFGGTKLTQITPWHVDKYKSKRLKDTSRFRRPISKATINRELACLKKMLTYAVGEKWLHANPLKGYKLFQERPNKVRVVSNDEFQNVYNYASEFLKPILVTAYNTGMRRGEILKLRWGNVNLSEDYITVEDSKNGESRHIPMNKHLKVTLKSVKSYSTSDYVFSRSGEPPKCFKTAFDRAVTRSGVVRFTFHDLRHTFASNLVMKGVDIVTVQELLGHKTIAMTKRYSHPSPEHKKQAVNKLNLDCMDTYLDTNVAGFKNMANITT